MSNCCVCKKDGAEWLVRTNNDQPLPCHKQCGKDVEAMAPEGVTVKVSPSRELRQRWDDERRQRDVHAFWKDKFQNAKPLDKSGSKDRGHLVLVGQSSG